MGEITIRRVFGDMALHKGWANETSYTATHCATSAGKNRADMMLVVAAMDFASRGLATSFVIVSDDRDFGPLVSHLCEHGFRVDWVGKPKPQVAKVQAVTPTAAKPPAIKTTTMAAATPKTALDMRLFKVIAAEPNASQGVTLVRLGHLMKGDTVKEQTGKATWRAYLREKLDLFILEGAAGETRVRLKT